MEFGSRTSKSNFILASSDYNRTDKSMITSRFMLRRCRRNRTHRSRRFLRRSVRYFSSLVDQNHNNSADLEYPRMEEKLSHHANPPGVIDKTQKDPFYKFSNKNSTTILKYGKFFIDKKGGNRWFSRLWTETRSEKLRTCKPLYSTEF